MSARIVIAGIGSEYRRDDGAGPAVAERLAASSLGVGDVGPLGEPLDLLGRWDDADLAIIVDAVRSGAAPGTIELLDLNDDGTRPGGIASALTSTHGIGAIGALRIARAVGHAPRRVVVVAIEGAEFGAGIGLSPAVARAVDIATARVIQLVEASR